MLFPRFTWYLNYLNDLISTFVKSGILTFPLLSSNTLSDLNFIFVGFSEGS